MCGFQFSVETLLANPIHFHMYGSGATRCLHVCIIGRGGHGKIFEWAPLPKARTRSLVRRDNRCVTVLIYFADFMETTAQVYCWTNRSTTQYARKQNVRKIFFCALPAN